MYFIISVDNYNGKQKNAVIKIHIERSISNFSFINELKIIMSKLN